MNQSARLLALILILAPAVSFGETCESLFRSERSSALVVTGPKMPLIDTAFAIPVKPNQYIRNKRFSSDSRWLLLDVWDHTAKASRLVVVDTKTRAQRSVTLPADTKMGSMTISPSGRYVLLQESGGYLTVVDLANSQTKSIQIPWSENGGTAYYPNFSFWPDGSALWSSGKGDIVRFDPKRFLNSLNPVETLSKIRTVESSSRQSYMHPSLSRDWASQLLVRDNRYTSLEFTPLQGNKAGKAAGKSAGKTVIVPLSVDSKGTENAVFVRASIFDSNVFLATEHERTTGTVKLLAIEPNIGKASSVWQGSGDFVSDLVVSWDGKSVAFLIEVSPGVNDAVVVDIATGKEKLRVPRFSQTLVHSNYFNKNVHVSGSMFVFGSALPQRLLTFDPSTGKTDQLEIDSRTDIAHSAGGHLKYAANYYVNPNIDGLVYVAPGSVDGVKLRSGFYIGSQRVPISLLPEAAPQQIGHLQISPNGEFLVALKAEDAQTVTEVVVLRMRDPAN